MIRVSADLSRLHRMDIAIATATGKSIEDVLAKEAREVSWETYKEVRRIAPGPMRRATTLAEAAKVRGYEMGRIGNSLTPAQAGISARAWRAARNLLGSERSAFFKVTENAGGPLVRRAMFGGRSGKLLKGGRHGNRFAPSAKGFSQLTSEQQTAALTVNPELKRLNLRAVATAKEISLRAGAARGSTVAIQFLPRFYRKSKSATVKNGPLVEHSDRTNIPIGQIDFIQRGGNLSGVLWQAFVPGTDKVMDRNNIMARVEAARVADRTVYLERKIKERFAKLVLS